MKTKTYNEMDYFELENIATAAYNLKDYNFAAVEECGNDSSHTFNPTGIIDKWEAESAASIRAGKVPSYSNSILLECLVADGYLEAGNYIIHVSW